VDETKLMSTAISQEKIAIVLATYNPDSQYLAKQLASIRQQTWRNWFCYVVDDCSTAECQEKIQTLVGNDPRFSCHFHEKNVGSYHNFERGLQYCALDETIGAIAFSDQDDIWHPEKLKTLLQSMRSSHALLAHSDLLVVNEQEQVIHPSCWEYEGRNPEKLTPELLLLRNTVTGCALIFCASLLPQVLPFPIQRRPAWHHDLWVALAAAKLGTIAHLRQPLVAYRLHDSNSIGAVKDAGKLGKELTVWAEKKFRVTGNSYIIHHDLSQAFYGRFAPDAPNPFDDRSLDFGLGILRLGWRSYWTGYGSEGITLRIFLLKFLFDLNRLLKPQQFLP
jgi:glycosyltransferase involved in cell wall biosynthesis